MKKPLIVYISGAPGSGKTELAKLVSEQLYTIRMSSDLVHGGIALSQPNHNRGQAIVEVYVPALIDLAKRGISLVADHSLKKGLGEVDIIGELKPYAEVVYIHTQTADPISRFVKRTKTSTIPSIIARQEKLLGRVDYHTENLSVTSQPLKLDVPTLVVNTDDGYDPTLNEIILFIRANY